MVADDLTGAAEMGVLLVAHGLRTVVAFDPVDSGLTCDAIVIDTESRHLRPSEAAARVQAATAYLRSRGAGRLFKKVDSTLRGNVEGELRAFAPDVIFTPAYPAHGRIVRDGVLYVNGIAWAETVFAREGRPPGRAMHEASTDDDLQRLIDKHPNAAFAGSSGLGRAWVASLLRGDQEPLLLPGARHPLLVCGSRHPVSRAQARSAEASGLRVLLSSEESSDPEREAAALAEEASRFHTDLLILFGGDTSAAVLRRMGLTALWPVRELMPGVALSMAREMMIVTKAGGFGGEHIVTEILQQLK